MTSKICSRTYFIHSNSKLRFSILLVFLLVCQIEYAHCIHNDESNLERKRLNEDSDSESIVTSEDVKWIETFVPTSEWKEIKKNQMIPRGLHVRMNLETGLKEAKLLETADDENESSRSLVHVPQSPELEVDSNDKEIKDPHLIRKEQLMRDNILEALKNIKSEDDKSPEELKRESKERKKLFRSYKELKAELEEINMTIESDSELLKRLLSEYKEVDNEQMRINILEDLDYLVHQVDNALDFVTMGGITQIILPGMNSSSNEIRRGVMRLIGSASQSNPKVQIAVLEQGLLGHLLRVVARERDTTLSSRAVFAVSCLVRGFPYGQQRLIESGGLHTLREVFHRHDWQSFPLQLKVVSLMQDLLLERKEVEKRRASQLNEVDLVGALVEGDWCSAIASLLSAASFDKRGMRQDLGAALGKGIPLRPDHDMVEKVVTTMAILSGQCRADFISDLSLLKSLKVTYDHLAYKEQFQGDEGHDFFRQVANQIQQLVQEIGVLNKDDL